MYFEEHKMNERNRVDPHKNFKIFYCVLECGSKTIIIIIEI